MGLSYSFVCLKQQVGINDTAFRKKAFQTRFRIFKSATLVLMKISF